MKNITNRAGNVLIVVLILGSLGLGGLGLFLANVGQFSKQVADAQNQAMAGDSNNRVLGFVMKKVALNGKNKSDWFTEFYPTANEMAQDQSKALMEALIEMKSMAPAANSSETYVALNLVRGKLDTASQCKPISPFIAKKQVEAGDCDVVAYGSDGSGLGALKSAVQAGGVNAAKAPSTLLGMVELGKLTVQDKLSLFVPGAKLPLNKVLDSVPVTFKKRIADPSNPNKLSKFLVSFTSGGKEMLGLVPVAAPANPLCQVSVLTPEPISFSLGDQTVKFQVKGDSVVSAVRISLPDGSSPMVSDGSQQPFLQDRLDPYLMSNYGTFSDLRKNTGFDLRISQAQASNIAGIVNPTNPNLQDWIIRAEVAGLDGTTSNCIVPLTVNKPLAPKCVFTADSLNPPPGTTVGLNLNCETLLGGPVTSAEITSVTADPSPDNRFTFAREERIVVGKIRNRRTGRLEDVFSTRVVHDPDLSKATSRIFKKDYKKVGRTIDRITARATGPGGVWTDTLSLDGGCPYADINFRRKEFGPSDWFKSKINENDESIEHPIGDLIFTRARFNYPSKGKYFASDEAKNLGLGLEWIAADGTWSGNGDSREVCDTASNYCMALIQMQNANYNSWTVGGKMYWVEVGPKRSATCAVINTKMRHGGCFSGETKLQMADGTERKVSQIGENDWLLNPFYNAPVRVKKVVKGPEKKSLWEVKYSDKKVVVTEDHPFLTQKGWVQTQTLKAGEVLIGDGQSQKVVSVKKLKYQAPEDVWNFELDTEDALGHIVLANGIPTGDLTTQLNLKSEMKKIH